MDNSSTVAVDDDFAHSLRRLKILTQLSLGLTVVALVWLVFASIAVFDLMSWIDNPGLRGDVVSAGLLLAFPAHLAMMGHIILALRRLGELRAIATISLVLCAVSTIAVVANFTGLHDIAKEYPLGIDIRGQLRWLQIGMVVHYVYLVCQLAMCSSAFSNLKKKALRESTRPGENLFNATNILGVACAAIGLALTLPLYSHHLPVRAWKWAVLPIVLLALMPYLLALAGWLYSGWKDRQSGFLDEKQKSDLMRAGTTAWIVSIPAMVVLFLVNYGDLGGPGSVLWLPACLFTSLLAFSASSLFYYRET